MSVYFYVNERATAKYTATIKDESGTAITLAAITTSGAKLTLKDESGNVINSRDGQDIRNTNNVTISTSVGLLTWTVQSADNSNAGSAVEKHTATFDITHATSKRVIHTINIMVRPITELSS